MTQAEQSKIGRRAWIKSGRKTTKELRMYLTAEWQEAQRLELEADELREQGRTREACTLYHKATKLEQAAKRLVG